jgi:succinyl-CoA synthetase beta subunit
MKGNVGTIGILTRISNLVNGAGLAMATNDTIDLIHGENANFLDTGGRATPDTINEAFRLVLKNPKVFAFLTF